MSEPNYHNTIFLTENVLEIKMKKKKTEILINKLVFFRVFNTQMSKILMYEFWYNDVKPKYEEKVKLCYMDIGSLIVYIKTVAKI